MKTVTKGAGEAKEVRRVSDVEGDTMVKSREWTYCPKQEWKKLHSPAPKNPKNADKPIKEESKGTQTSQTEKANKSKAGKNKRAYMEAKAGKVGKDSGNKAKVGQA